ncbi:hypothetical protein KIN20_032112 [Parelaphostrongylus tenuis]|uniref:Uncharacterized protein n=1 Tax=Parelaphostrongylus tenuis TaxID=148309 RepID=A0AAD5R6I1_PARTN|nr:hypothetical protein KIN20_032112 [Parelaphostrongylus tenuis]
MDMDHGISHIPVMSATTTLQMPFHSDENGKIKNLLDYVYPIAVSLAAFNADVEFQTKSVEDNIIIESADHQKSVNCFRALPLHCEKPSFRHNTIRGMKTVSE